MTNRRDFLRLAAIGAGSMLVAPRIVFANVATDRRFVFIIQRGAADGLNIVVPYADPAYAQLRGKLAIDAADAIKLDGTFALHPSLTNMGSLYTSQQALFVHAVASPYRERSHFDGQNVLETGGLSPYQIKDGWLNRLVTLLPKSADKAIAFAPTIPAALRGSAEVTSYAPSNLPEAPDDLLLRVAQLYDKDQQFHPVWSAAMEARGFFKDLETRQNPATAGKTAAEALVRADGPRIAMIETSGWDTHSGQDNRLANQLKALDSMIAALRDGLGDIWAQTTVLVATEFGRTAAANGTGGTDHGTATTALVLGGAVKGGRILTDWPGLSPNALYENRDLKPTMDLDALITAIAAETFGLDTEHTMKTLFPGRPIDRSLHGLIIT
ncbi:DUF1501 domain-containing protein [Phyllobacterium sp. 628]|uniref:DUF1501 domain-containing protein n=1 Tax=Phyllobacterium sp. 628 TaxID=2718938 RepID=UPI0016626E83|nr:DUF1501 domain-containing protein [Phyllobacterium sp. 628]QND50912.1 DUF1501 domain-containing protein [Phyllobacterium sp. 628]